MKSEAFRFGFEKPTSIRFIITQAGRLRTDLSFWAFACDEINWSSYRRQKCCLDKIWCFKVPVKKAFYRRAAHTFMFFADTFS